LVGADEIVPPLLTAEPLVEGVGLLPLEPDESRPEPISDPLGFDPMLEPTLEPIPEDEGQSLEEIIAAAERQEAIAKSAAWHGDVDDDELVPAAPLADEEEAVAEPVADDALLREAFGVTPLPEPLDD
jgi:hypothetical protein